MNLSIHICVHVCVHVCVCVCVDVFVYVCVCVHVCRFMCVCMCVCDVHMCVCVCIYMCVCVYVCHRFPGGTGGSSGLHRSCYWIRDISGVVYRFVLRVCVLHLTPPPPSLNKSMHFVGNNLWELTDKSLDF